MKREIIEDLKLRENKILLHEEKVEDGKFVIVPVWDKVTSEEIETPSDVYSSLLLDGTWCF